MIFDYYLIKLASQPIDLSTETISDLSLAEGPEGQGLENGPASAAGELIKTVQANSTGSRVILDVDALKTEVDTLKKIAFRTDDLEASVADLQKTAIRRGVTVIFRSGVDGGTLLGSNLQLWPNLRGMSPSDPKSVYQRWLIEPAP